MFINTFININAQVGAVHPNLNDVVFSILFVSPHQLLGQLTSVTLSLHVAKSSKSLLVLLPCLNAIIENRMSPVACMQVFISQMLKPYFAEIAMAISMSAVFFCRKLTGNFQHCSLSKCILATHGCFDLVM